MRIAEYTQWVIITFFSLLIVRALYPKNWPPAEKVIFSVIVAIVFFFLIGAFWLTTGKKFDEVVYEAVLCPLHAFARCEPLTAEEEERRRLQEEQRRKAEAERREAERKREAERQEARREQERQEQAQREREAERRREAERQEQARRDRERQEQAQRQQEERRQEEERRRSLRFAATAMGHQEHRWYAVTVRDQQSYAEAESRAMTRCNQEVQECRIVARFSGPGRCAYVAGGNVVTQQYGRVNRRSGARVGPTEGEAIQKCSLAFQNCRIFHSGCNSS
jgi:hypothetical protein